MRRLLAALYRSGLWLQPLVFAVLYFLARAQSPGGDWAGGNVLPLLLLSCLPVAAWHRANAQKSQAKLAQRERRREQQSQDIPANMKKSRPEPGDLILGKYRGSYVVTSLRDTDSHYAIIGTSGTGKTSCFLLNNLILNASTGALVLDVKDSELFRKSTRLGDPNVRKFDPEDRESWGYDPFYLLRGGTPSEEALLQTMQLVANSLISIPADAKDKFWPNSAKNLFLGLSISLYRAGYHNLIDIVDAILGQPIEGSIRSALEDSSPQQPEYRYLIMFQGMEAVTLYGVYAELAGNLTVFANHPGIRWAFRDNPRTIAPPDLEEGRRIFLCVDQTELATLGGVVKLILDGMLYQMQRRCHGRPESELEPLLFVIDELPQLLSSGPLSQLIQGLRVLRSSRVRMILAFQTIESLEGAYSHAQVVDLCSNCNHLIVLNGGNSTATLEMVCSLAGQFSEKRQSVSTGGRGSTTTSYEERNILTPAEINRMPQQGKALVLGPSGYLMLDKAPYYRCKYIAPLAEEIAAYNRQIMELKRPAAPASGKE